MTQSNEERSLEALVPADKGGSSGLPVAAQRAVPAESGDLIARLEYLESMRRNAARELNALKRYHAALEVQCCDLRNEIKARKTPVGGNVAISCEGGHTPSKRERREFFA